MTEGGGFIQRGSIIVIIVKPEIKPDRICGEFCTAINYINTIFCSLPSKVLKLRYTQSSQETNQIQYWPLLLCPFPSVLQVEGHRLTLEEIPDWSTAELAVSWETVFCGNVNDLDFGKYRGSLIAVSH
nr:PREDICTED: UPF0728 protein C10orf53 homolog [Phalacrocorax carbo]